MMATNEVNINVFQTRTGADMRPRITRVSTLLTIVCILTVGWFAAPYANEEGANDGFILSALIATIRATTKCARRVKRSM